MHETGRAACAGPALSMTLIRSMRELTFLVTDCGHIYFRWPARRVGGNFCTIANRRGWGKVARINQGAFMVRTVLGVAAGVIAWLVLVTVMDRAMRYMWPDYAANFTAMTFTVQMMFARLAESTVALIIASMIAAGVAPTSRAVSWAFGILMLAFFIPVHYTLWHKFPIWYHAYFLLSLVAVPVLVASAMRAKSSAA